MIEPVKDAEDTVEDIEAKYIENVEIEENSVHVSEVFKLAFPSILSMMSITVQNFIDTAFISHVGTPQIAGVGLITWYMWTLLSFFRGLSSVTNSFVARYLGSRRLKSIGVVAWHFIYLSLIFGLIYFIIGKFTPNILKLINPPKDAYIYAVEYSRIRFYEAFFIISLFIFDDFFKGLKRPDISMVIIGIVSGLNIFLDYILIFGKFGFPQLGVKGAALATVISEFFGFGMFLYIYLSKKYRSKYLTHRLPHFSLILFKKILRIGTPAGAQNILDAGSFLIFGIIVAKMGTDSLAINQIVIQILSLTFMLGLGFSRAATTLVSAYMGAKNLKNARKSVYIATFLALSIMLPVAITFVAMPELYLRIFTNDKILIIIGKKILLIAAIYEVVDAVGLVYSGGLIGAGDTKFTMWVIMASAWGLFLPATYILGIIFEMGIVGAWIAMAMYIFIFGIMVFIRFSGKKWEEIKI